MKRLILTAVVIAALALALAPLAGAHGWKHGQQKFNAVGKVVAVSVADTTVDPAAVSTITIKVQGGSHIKVAKHTKAMKHVARVFTMAAGAKIWQLTDDGQVAKTLADLAAGDKVFVRGTVAKVTDATTGAVSIVFTVNSLKYRDRTPDAAPVPDPTPSPSASAVAQ